MLNSDKQWSLFQEKRKLFSVILASFLLVGAIVTIVLLTSSGDNSDDDSKLSIQSEAILKMSCSSTLYPDLCYSAVATVVGANTNLRTLKEVIETSLNITITAVRQNYFTVKKLTAIKNLKNREKTALHDCLETIDDSLDELENVVEDLHHYPNKKSLLQHADDLKTLMSAAMTNQETCLDGFSHDESNKKVREQLLAGQVHVERMCSNALAMIKNMTDTDLEELKQKKASRKLETSGGGGWPEWLKVGDRKLLEASTVEANVVVAKDGRGDYETVGAAVEDAPKGSKERYVIRIKAGVYEENVEVPKKKINIMFIGDGRNNTIITASRNVVDGSTTFHSATVAVVGAGFLARDITFENTAGPLKHQAVALRVGSDLSAFYKCDILAYQDSLYVHSNRQFFTNCLITGTVDFIFGNGAAIFQNCDIHARLPHSGQKNMVTAQGRKDPNQNTGIVIQKCRIGATSDLIPLKGNFSTYLGRPWKEYSRTVIMQTNISDVIDPAGWHEWNETFAFDTLVYREYENKGEGALTSKRVKWNGLKVIGNESEVLEFTAESFIGAQTWLNSTGFPFILGL